MIVVSNQLSLVNFHTYINKQLTPEQYTQIEELLDFDEQKVEFLQHCQMVNDRLHEIYDDILLLEIPNELVALVSEEEKPPEDTDVQPALENLDGIELGDGGEFDRMREFDFDDASLEELEALELGTIEEEDEKPQAQVNDDDELGYEDAWYVDELGYDEALYASELSYEQDDNEELDDPLLSTLDVSDEDELDDAALRAIAPQWELMQQSTEPDPQDQPTLEVTAQESRVTDQERAAPEHAPVQVSAAAEARHEPQPQEPEIAQPAVPQPTAFKTSVPQPAVKPVIQEQAMAQPVVATPSLANQSSPTQSAATQTAATQSAATQVTSKRSPAKQAARNNTAAKQPARTQSVSEPVAAPYVSDASATVPAHSSTAATTKTSQAPVEEQTKVRPKQPSRAADNGRVNAKASTTNKINGKSRAAEASPEPRFAEPQYQELSLMDDDLGPMNMEFPKPKHSAPSQSGFSGYQAPGKGSNDNEVLGLFDFDDDSNSFGEQLETLNQAPASSSQVVIVPPIAAEPNQESDFAAADFDNAPLETGKGATTINPLFDLNEDDTFGGPPQRIAKFFGGVKKKFSVSKSKVPFQEQGAVEFSSPLPMYNHQAPSEAQPAFEEESSAAEHRPQAKPSGGVDNNAVETPEKVNPAQATSDNGAPANAEGEKAAVSDVVPENKAGAKNKKSFYKLSELLDDAIPAQPPQPNVNEEEKTPEIPLAVSSEQIKVPEQPGTTEPSAPERQQTSGSAGGVARKKEIRKKELRKKKLRAKAAPGARNSTPQRAAEIKEKLSSPQAPLETDLDLADIARDNGDSSLQSFDDVNLDFIDDQAGHGSEATLHNAAVEEQPNKDLEVDPSSQSSQEVEKTIFADPTEAEFDALAQALEEFDFGADAPNPKAAASAHVVEAEPEAFNTQTPAAARHDTHANPSVVSKQPVAVEQAAPVLTQTESDEASSAFNEGETQDGVDESSGTGFESLQPEQQSEEEQAAEDIIQSIWDIDLNFPGNGAREQHVAPSAHAYDRFEEADFDGRKRQQMRAPSARKQSPVAIEARKIPEPRSKKPQTQTFTSSGIDLKLDFFDSKPTSAPPSRPSAGSRMQSMSPSKEAPTASTAYTPDYTPTDEHASTTSSYSSSGYRKRASSEQSDFGGELDMAGEMLHSITDIDMDFVNRTPSTRAPAQNGHPYTPGEVLAAKQAQLKVEHKENEDVALTEQEFEEALKHNARFKQLVTSSGEQLKRRNRLLATLLAVVGVTLGVAVGILLDWDKRLFPGDTHTAEITPVLEKLAVDSHHIYSTREMPLDITADPYLQESYVPWIKTKLAGGVKRMAFRSLGFTDVSAFIIPTPNDYASVTVFQNKHLERISVFNAQVAMSDSAGQFHCKIPQDIDGMCSWVHNSVLFIVVGDISLSRVREFAEAIVEQQ